MTRLWPQKGRNWGSTANPKEHFFFTTGPRSAPGPTRPPTKRVPVTVPPGVRRPEHEGGHSSPLRRLTLMFRTIHLIIRTPSWLAVYLIAGTPFLLTYLLTSWSRVLLEKLTGFQLVKKFAAFYGTRKFITAFAGARHLSLS